MDGSYGGDYQTSAGYDTQRMAKKNKEVIERLNKAVGELQDIVKSQHARICVLECMMRSE